MPKELLDKAKEYRTRAASLREKARALNSEPARAAMLQAAATWDELAQSAEREASWRDLAQRSSLRPSEED
jgi:hypothetical protein